MLEMTSALLNVSLNTELNCPEIDLAPEEISVAKVMTLCHHGYKFHDPSGECMYCGDCTEPVVITTTTIIPPTTSMEMTSAAPMTSTVTEEQTVTTQVATTEEPETSTELTTEVTTEEGTTEVMTTTEAITTTQGRCNTSQSSSNLKCKSYLSWFVFSHFCDIYNMSRHVIC